MREKIETYIVVSLITVLVWLYAEGENVRTYPNEPVSVRFVAPPGRELAIDPAEPVQVFVTLQASTGQYRRVKELTAEPLELVVTPPDNGPTERVVVVRDALLQSPLGELGISIAGTDPITLPLRVEPLERVTLPVTVSAGDVQLAANPVSEPAEVEVRMPASLVPLASGRRVIAALDELDLSGFEVNDPQTASVPLELPPVLQRRFVTLGQGTATVRFTIRKLTDTATLASVPVHISVPPSWLERFRIELSPDQRTIPDVVLSGPADVIEQVRQKQARVVAEIRPSIDDLEDGAQSLPVYFTLPTGVRLESARPIVNVQITRVEDGPEDDADAGP